MEDGSDGLSSVTVLPPSVRNGEVMANFPDVDCSVDDDEAKNRSSPVKVNGDSNPERVKSEDESDSSDYDALVIDESVKPKKSKSTKPRCGGFKGFKKSSISDTFVHTNPYFAESIFDLLEKSQEKKQEDSSAKEGGGKRINCKNHTKNPTDKKTKANPKLREYAQYLGLQPTVQFKCSKCSRSGFPSLGSLNEHLLQCNESVPVNDSSTVNNVSSGQSTNIRVTRKVFLCSACGTYYENWNLFLHMREVHKRFICLYCLGMFSHPDKLAVHIVSKHNCVPNHITTLDEFYNLHGEPCFLMCCECQRGFTERDNFFEHTCIENSRKQLGQKQGARLNNKKSKTIEHVTADSINNECITTDVVASADAGASDSALAEISAPNDDNRNADAQISSDNLKSECDSNVLSEDIGRTEGLKSQAPTDTETTGERGNSPDLNNEENKSITSETEQQNSEICDNLSDPDSMKKSSDHVSSQIDNTSGENVAVTENDKVVESETKVKQDTDETKSFEEEEEEMSASDQENSDGDVLNDSFDMNLSEEADNEPGEEEVVSEAEDNAEPRNEDDTRRVPKVTLKLSKNFDNFHSDKDEDDDDVPVYESDDSEKLTMEIDRPENDEVDEGHVNDDDEILPSSSCDLQVAGPDVSIIELELEQPLDKFDIRLLLQKCLKSTVPSCVYCNHARRISVNGKQLGLHAIAEHRFSAIVNSITAEELIPESFVARIRDCLPELENVFFNLESSNSEEAITFSHVFECFQCRYSTMIHKELYLHNRKMHAKSILLCIMCKSNFYSYSELICHLCPGLYELDNDVQFRCCMCVSDKLPSAFRLMVHLRKKHHACDVCLELCHNQSRLSNHVWKHKLHHLCYRCGIAYRNKPDITKHLFWKHGTESVLCKKCLQKKWPHVYHFCIPPTIFTCEECNLTFTRAMSLMVHKRLHTNVKPHACTEENCTETFISKKLLLKHEFKHREPTEDVAKLEAGDKILEQESDKAELTTPIAENVGEDNAVKDATETDDKLEKAKPKVDVYDLPELNLSESDSSDSEDETQKNIANESGAIAVNPESNEPTASKDVTELEKPTPVLETIWDDFRNYQANKEKLYGAIDTNTKEEEVPSLEVILKDHDYCIVQNQDVKEASGGRENAEMSVDHDYCFGGPSKEHADKRADNATKKKTTGSSSSNSSSDSDSSSCTCGSNCSCSSSSGSSSSSSDSSESDSSTSAGRRRQQQRRERRKQKSKTKKASAKTAPVDVVVADNPPVTFEVPIRESDLQTSESDTDEDFYDKQPQKLANKLLAEKKNQLLQMAAIGPYINGSIMDGSRPQTPSLPEEAPTKPKKKSKSKKRKKKNKSSKYETENPNTNIPACSSYPIVSPLTLMLPKNSPTMTPLYHSPNTSNVLLPNMNLPSMSRSMSSLSENDSSLRASKRRRVPNKFYGYSSDEDQDKIPQPPVFKWRKVDLPTPKSPLVVPPITIKTVSAPAPTVDPISIRSMATSGELRVQQSKPQSVPVPKTSTLLPHEPESASESNESSSDEELPPVKEQPALYCYCRCPYDEVSEMIGCDASDCAIEWFHFECVGIMVPPKGQWFCPDCRKKKQQRREMLQNQLL